MAVNVTSQPMGMDSVSSYIDKLLVSGEFRTREVTLLQDASLTTDLLRGQLLVPDASGKFVRLAAAEVTVPLNATSEVVKNSLATTDLICVFTCAKPPIPGTMTMAVTADGSATVVKDLGTDNGFGTGVGADGRFEIDYQTGRGVAYLSTAPTATHDLKAGYKHRNPGVGVGSSPLGLPSVVLAEDILSTLLVAGDVKTIGYTEGKFLASALVGYSAGYREFMRLAGLTLQV